MSIILPRILQVSIYLFAIIGLFFVSGFVATKFGFTNTAGIIDTQQKSFLNNTETSYVRFPLAHTPEWVAFRQAVAKDKLIIEQVSKETGVPGRVLIAILVPEQMRLFHSNRPIFKQIFEPLKILGSQSQFSWGIFGIKDETARAVERHLVDQSSPFYLGTAFEHSLDFKTSSADQERFSRIIDEHDHTYGYRYAALYVAQITKQWEKAGFSISGRPDILATLWNIGFEHSVPKKDPQSGGAPIEIDGDTYSFGELANIFYSSDEMIELFPVLYSSE